MNAKKTAVPPEKLAPSKYGVAGIRLPEPRYALTLRPKATKRPAAKKDD